MDYVQFLAHFENHTSICDVFIQPGEFIGHFSLVLHEIQ